MTTKLQTLRDAYAAGDIQKAAAIAARFPRLGQHRNAILDAQMAYQNPRFCLGIKKEPAALIAAGKAAIEAAYINSSSEYFDFKQK